MPDNLVKLGSYFVSSKYLGHIDKSFIGKLFGPATGLVLMLVFYIAAVTILYEKWSSELKQLYSDDPRMLILFFGTPLAIILVFSLLPTVAGLIRTRNLRKLAKINSDSIKKDSYFRLTPYEAIDHKSFSRPDGALKKCLDWIEGDSGSVLYLSGASGSGKSSLIAAGVGPNLGKNGWDVVQVRGLGQPLSELKAALLKHSHLFHTPPSKRSKTMTLLKRASEEIERSGKGPLLIVLDQFEEFLILESGEEKEVYSDFINELYENPLDNIHLLHVFREDYRSLIFKLKLPDFTPNETGFDLAPFSRADAQAFLKAGGRALSTEGYTRLFSGLDRIEKAHGLYRPITLNMIGYILRLEDDDVLIDPSTLIESYLKRLITRGNAQDFSQPVLEAMITNSGTKIPVNLDELVKATGIEPHNIQATLVDLQLSALVRRVADGRWEISHDFIAAIIGRIIGRLRPSIIRRFANPVLVVTTIIWVLLAIWLVPEKMHSRALDAITNLGFVRVPNGQGEFGLEYQGNETLTDELFQELGQQAAWLSVTSLKLSQADMITDLTPLEGFKNLRSLTIDGGSGVQNLSGMESLTRLHTLSISSIDMLKDLSGLETLSNLQELHLRDVRSLSNLTGLQRLASLKKLELYDAESLPNLSGLETLSGLEELRILNALSLTSLSGAKDLTSIQSITVTGAIKLSGFQGLEALSSLRDLKLYDCTSLENLAGIEALSNLRSLEITGLTSLQTIASLAGLANLEVLHLKDITQLESLNGIEDLSNLHNLELEDAFMLNSLQEVSSLDMLETLDLIAIPLLQSLQGVEHLTRLQSLKLIGATALSSLVELNGLAALQTLHISGVEELESLTGIEGLLSLQTLIVNDASKLTNLSGIEQLPNLKSLELVGARNLRDFTDLETLAERDGISITTSGLNGIVCEYTPGPYNNFYTFYSCSNASARSE